MLWGKDDTALYLGLWGPWHQTDEIHHKRRNGMIDDGQVGISPFRRFFVQFYIYLFLLLIGHTLLVFGYKKTLTFRPGCSYCSDQNLNSSFRAMISSYSSLEPTMILS